MKLILLITKVHKKINQQHLWKINYLLLSIAISLAFFKITSIRERIFYQLVIILMLFYFSAKKHLTKRHKIISKISLLFFACTMYVSNLVKPTKIAHMPYQSYFQVWLFNDYGNGEERQKYVRFLTNYSIKKEKARTRGGTRIRAEGGRRRRRRRRNKKKSDYHPSCKA